MGRVLLTYLRTGGPINVCLFAICCLIMYIGFGRLFLYLRLGRKKSLTSGNIASLPPDMEKGNRLVFECLGVLTRNRGRSPAYYENRFREILLKRVPKLEAGLDTMATLITAAPLLGLLGTVIGMIRTFAIITEFGVGNPNLLAEGISIALVTTQAGLVVSFPSLLFHVYLKNRKDHLVNETIADAEKLLNEMRRESVEC